MSAPGPHWVKIPPRSTIRLHPAPELSNTVPAFQADPSVPPGSVRIVRHAQGVDLQNFHDRAVAVGVIFVEPDTIESLALFTKALKEPGKDPP